MKKVYFAGAILKWDGDTTDMYPRIIDVLKKHFDVLSEHVNRWKPTSMPPSEVFLRDVGMINQADIVIAEVSAPSHWVGREIAYAQFHANIPVYLLHRAGGKVSFMLIGNDGIPQDHICSWETLEDIDVFCKDIA